MKQVPGVLDLGAPCVRPWYTATWCCSIAIAV